MSARIYHTSTPTHRGFWGAPITLDTEHLGFLAMRRERQKQKEQADGRTSPR